MANVSAAKSVLDSGSAWRQSGWVWNPYFGMLTFIPVRGGLYSPFGYSYYCPRNVIAVYVPRMGGGSVGGGSVSAFSRGYDSNLGYSVSSQRTYGGYSSSAGSVSSGGMAAAPAAVSESPRSAESATPRGGEGGGRGQ